MSEHRDREHVAPGVRKVHTRDCARSQGVRRRCSCQPSYAARVKVGQRGRSRELSKTFLTLAEATRWREDTLAGIDGRRTGPMPTLGEAAESFMHRARAGTVTTRSGKPYASTTLDAYESHLRLHVLPTLDRSTGFPVSDLPADRLLSPRALSALVSTIAANGARSGTLRGSIAALRAVLLYLYDEGPTDTPPPTVKMPPPHKRRVRVYTTEERRALLVEAQVYDFRQRRSLMYPLLAMIDGTGLRVSELLAVTWGPDGLMVGDGEGVVRVTDSKTATGIRSVPFTGTLARILADHRKATGAAEGALVFGPREDGKPYTRGGAPRYGLRRIAAAAGVEDVGWHAFRRTHATVLGTLPGTDEVTLAARLGHSDPAFTKRTYIVPQEDRAHALARLAATFDPLPDNLDTV